MSEEITKDEAENGLAKAGPGGICAECGHWAMRHWTNKCHFALPHEKDCECKGMLWQGHRVDIGRVMDIASKGEYKGEAKRS